jgi:lysyl-tRNA synthetase class 2
MASDASLTLRWRLLRLLLRAAHNRFQLERLVRFNEKFFPAWRSRFLVYRSGTQLPRAALRVLQAEAYVRPPRPRPLPAAWRPLPDPVVALTRQAR